MDNKKLCRRISKYRGFTLAETLITLAIIGIVAAMTLPALVQNYKKKEYSTKLKKFYSVMSQAIKLSEIDNGPSGEWIIPTTDKGFDSSLSFFNTYFKPYMKVISTEKNSKINEGVSLELPEQNLRVSLSDGSVFYLTLGSCVDIDFDVNGVKPPNEAGRDIYKFVLCPKNNIETTLSKKENQNFSAYCPSIKNRDTALKNCARLSRVCPCLLQYDNWEFKDDYPHKL